MEKVNCESILIAEGIKQILGESTIVHVSTGPHSRRRNFLAWITAFHDQRDPFLDLSLIIGILHPVIQVMGRKRFEAFLKERNIFRAAHKTHVGYGMNKGLRVFDRSL